MIVDRCSTRIGFCEGRSLKCDCYVKVKDGNTIQDSPIGGKASLFGRFSEPGEFFCIIFMRGVVDEVGTVHGNVIFSPI